MIKKVAVLGSTGSIGKSLLNIIARDKKKFQILLLTANKNYKVLLNQAIKYNVKNLIITNKKSFEILKKSLKKNKSIKLFNNYNCFNKIFKTKLDYTMSSIVGIEGLDPTLKIIKFTNKIAIANKESIICGWNLIQKELKKYKTKFIPVDSEHFSIWYGLQNHTINHIDKIYITASGGPFFKTPLNKFKNIKLNQATKHPNWNMGKKISVDSSTMINKIYEVIEAKNIFDIPYKDIKIILHPKSYVHALIKFNNGLIKIIAHDTTMQVPIFNTLYLNTTKKINSKNINIQLLNNLNFTRVNLKRYPMIKLLNFLPNKSSLFETVLVAANDTLVEQFLSKNIEFIELQKILFKFIKLKEFNKYKKNSPKNVHDIIKLNQYVRLKLLKNVYKFRNVK